MTFCARYVSAQIIDYLVYFMGKATLTNKLIKKKFDSQIMDLGLLIPGAVLFIVGILFIVYNRRITKGYMSKLGKATGSEAFKSKGLGVYGRMRFYFAAVVFILLGLFFVIGGLR